MKINHLSLGRIAYAAVEAGVDDELGNCEYGVPTGPDAEQLYACDRAELGVGILRAIANRQKRFVIDITYPSKPSRKSKALATPVTEPVEG